MSTLLDTPFEKENDKPPEDEGRFFFDADGHAEKVSDAPAMVVVGDKKEEEIEIAVVDDTPEKDKGRPVADITEPEKNGLDADEEIKQYSQGVQKRFNELTARAHAERRAAEDRERQLAEAVEHLKRINAENNRLKEVLENGEKALMDEHKSRLEVALKQAKQMYREAAEAGDNAGMAAAQEEIARSVAQMERATSYRPTQMGRSDEKELLKNISVPPSTTPAQPQASQAAREWQMRNQWFGSAGEEPMSNYAMGVHQQIMREGKVVPDTKEYFDRIDSELHKRFPERFTTQRTETRRTPAPVAGATRQAEGGSKRVVQLTESQVRLAKRLNLTPQQYAAQLLKEQEAGHGKDFTYSA